MTLNHYFSIYLAAIVALVFFNFQPWGHIVVIWLLVDLLAVAAPVLYYFLNRTKVDWLTLGLLSVPVAITIPMALTGWFGKDHNVWFLMDSYILAAYSYILGQRLTKA